MSDASKCCLVVALLLVGGCARDLSLPDPQFGTIRGRITVTGEPAPGVTVRIDRSTLATTSRSDGSFTFRRLPVGTYELIAELDAENDGIAELSQRSPGVEIEAGGDDLDVGDIDLQPTGSASGTVTTGGGALRPGALVFVPGTRLAAFTGGDGQYVLAGVAPGDRTIGATFASFRPAIVAATIPSAENAGGVDFELQPDDGAKTSGFVGRLRHTDAPSSIARGTVQLFSSGVLVADAEANDDFHVGSLPVGVYTIRFDSPGHRTLFLPQQVLVGELVDLGVVWLEEGTPSPTGAGDGASDGGTLPLFSPRHLIAAAGDRRVTLSWDPPEAGANTYVVYRADPVNTIPAPLDGGTVRDRFFVDSSVDNFVAYDYWVTALVRGQESPFEHAPSVRAIPGPGSVISGSTGTRTLTEAGNPHVVVNQDLVVLSGDTLTLEPGVELRFEAGRKLLVQGTLIARGSLSEPIIFSELSPTGGWGGLVIEKTATNATWNGAGEWISGTVLEHAIIERSKDTGLTILSSSPLVLRTEIRENTRYESATVSFAGGVHIGLGAAPLFRLCNIHHNTVGIVEPGVTSLQWGAGVYSEGNPIFWENEIAYNDLLASTAANSTSRGGGFFLKSGAAILSRNLISATAVVGTGQANTAEVLRVRGLAIAAESGSHRLVNNLIQNNTASAAPADMQGTVWLNQGTHLFVRNRVSGNALGGTSDGAALFVATATVRGFLNQFDGNRLTVPDSPSRGSAVYLGENSSVLRYNNFVGNTPVTHEIYNTGISTVDLTSNHFSDLGTTPIASRVFRPTAADTSDERTEAFAALGPQACVSDGDCSPLGGSQRCFYGGCIPVCLLDGCPVAQTCDALAAACGP